MAAPGFLSDKCDVVIIKGHTADHRSARMSPPTYQDIDIAPETLFLESVHLVFLIDQMEEAIGCLLEFLGQ